MEHYYTAKEDKKENRRKIEFFFLNDRIEMMSDDNVFSKDDLDFGSRVLIETILKENIAGKVLDLGCGIGNIGILLKKYSSSDIELTMSDINVIACNLSKENSSLHRQNNMVIESDGFDNISDDFDAIVSNPPIRTGKKNIYQMFADAYNHLKEKGILYLVIRKQQGAESAVRYLQSIGFSVSVINKEKGYWIIKNQK